ncbi:epithelial membrane protein 2 isoform X1 [Phacochoerus africanus]|uniref:epithelial membrane protein 2 isoform X1 n=1 Tax=Phacochoerus africanus TaxID=41426 RepID=UPI001FDA0FA1|nr:epithelial membrane protein 2 isoform X1 [Phacochoerus africanus]
MRRRRGSWKLPQRAQRREPSSSEEARRKAGWGWGRSPGSGLSLQRPPPASRGSSHSASPLLTSRPGRRDREGGGTWGGGSAPPRGRREGAQSQPRASKQPGGLASRPSPSVSPAASARQSILLKLTQPLEPRQFLCCRSASGCLGRPCSSSKVSCFSSEGPAPHEGPFPLTAWSQRTELKASPPLAKTTLIPVFQVCVEQRREFWEPSFRQEPWVQVVNRLHYFSWSLLCRDRIC